MSTRVYLSKNSSGTTREEDTPLRSRIQGSSAPVKAWPTRLQQAYQHDAVRFVRRTTVRIDMLGDHVPVERLCERWGLRPACLYGWRQACLRRGMDRLVSRPSGGRRPQRTPKQQQRLGERMEAGPLVVGGETACWNSVLIRVLIWREFGVLSNRHDICTLLSNLGFSFQKAPCVSDHLDAATRLAWLAEPWPTLCRAAKRCPGLILCEDEASCAQGGALRSTGARRGQQPEVRTSGQRKGSQVCGARASCSGRFCCQGIAGRGHSASAQTCLPMILDQPTAPLFLIQDGARYHRRAATKAVLAAQSHRRTAYPLPSSSPDSHPMAYLGKKTTPRATPHQYFKACAALTVSVDTALAYFARHPETVLGLCGLYCEASDLERKQAA